MASQFDREITLIGEGKFKKLNSSKVIVFGVGGVGGFTIEALTRAGVGTIDIVDKDVVDITNLNRQIIATHDTIGKSKVEVMKKRMLSINPEVSCQALNMFYLPEEKDKIDFKSYDYVVDCIDNVTAKISIIEESKKAETRVISSMGTGNKLDPTGFKVADISKTSVCPLAKVMRKELKERGIRDVKVLYSTEEPVNTGLRTPQSISFVPSVAGLIIAGEVIKDLMED